MKLDRIIIAAIFSLTLSSCGLSGDLNRQNDSYLSATGGDVAQYGDNVPPATNLEDILRQLPGVIVTGNGSGTIVRIRGQVSSFNLDNTPLFVLDGTPLGNSFVRARNNVVVSEIDRIKVVKNAGDLGIYGVRGANGVIEIFSKRGGRPKQ